MGYEKLLPEFLLRLPTRRSVVPTVMDQSHQFVSPHPSYIEMINDPGFALAGADMLQNTAKLPGSASEETVPSTDEGQAKLKTAPGLATQAGMNVPVKCVYTSRTSAETGF